MNKVEEYEAHKLAIAELEMIKLVFVDGGEPEVPFRENKPRTVFKVEFSSSGRGLLLTRELVDAALKQNLGTIKETMRHLAALSLAEKRSAAIVEAATTLDSLQLQSG